MNIVGNWIVALHHNKIHCFIVRYLWERVTHKIQEQGKFKVNGIGSFSMHFASMLVL